jgi:hypothetical protein
MDSFLLRLMKNWNYLADWYDKKQGDIGDLWHRTLIDPVLVKFVGVVEEKIFLTLDVGMDILRGGLLERVLEWSRWILQRI